jgi:hypothetical protein
MRRERRVVSNAGPCGTAASAAPSCVSPIAWSVEWLLAPLIDYYERLPRHAWHDVGPKFGGGNGKGTLW